VDVTADGERDLGSRDGVAEARIAGLIVVAGRPLVEPARITPVRPAGGSTSSNASSARVSAIATPSSVASPP